MLLDTNVLSALRLLALDRADAAVRAWALASSETIFYLSAVTVLEVRFGILRRQRTDPVHAAVLQTWLDDQVLADFAGRILPVDLNVALACAPLHLHRTRPYLDSLIAATALVHNLPVVTRNTRDFADTGVRIVDPWAFNTQPTSNPASS